MIFLDAVILGVIEGVTEFLPISSTGHLILANSILHLTESDFTKTFEIAIQSGAILAVLAIYWKKFLDIPTLKKIIVGFIPTGVIGLLLYKIVKTYLLGNGMVVVAALAIGGILLIAFEYLHKENDTAISSIEGITYKKAALLGLFQSIAIVPGVSRSAATIIGGLFLGISRATIVEFSFLLAAPTLLAATGLDLLRSSNNFTSQEALLLIVGAVVSFVVAIFSIRFLLSYIRTHTFISFGIYRIAIALVFVFVLLH